MPSPKATTGRGNSPYPPLDLAHKSYVIKESTMKVFKPGTTYEIKEPVRYVCLSKAEYAELADIEDIDEYIERQRELKTKYARRYRFAVSKDSPNIQGCSIAPCIIQDELGNPAPYNGDIGCVAALQGHYSSYTDIAIERLIEVNA